MADYIYDRRNRLVRVTEEDGIIYITDKEADSSQVPQETAYTYGASLISEHRTGQGSVQMICEMVAQDGTRDNMETP